MENRLHVVVLPTEQEGKEGKVALFRVASDKINLPNVSLSRISGKCLFPAELVHHHDEHAPFFANDEELDIYIARVATDIQAAVRSGEGTTIEVREVEL